MKDQLISFWLKLLVICFVFLVFLRKAVVLLWWRPRKIEEHFSRQGIRGPPYRFFIGNVKELGVMMLNASSQPMPFSHNILPRVLSFYHHWKRIYGATFLVWFGPTVRLTISDPNLIKDIFSSNSGLYEKIEAITFELFNKWVCFNLLIKLRLGGEDIFDEVWIGNGETNRGSYPHEKCCTCRYN